MMKSSRTHYKHVLKKYDEQIFVYHSNVFVYHLYCMHVDIIVSVDMPNSDRDCIMVREG